jgi:hypothetical protein
LIERVFGFKDALLQNNLASLVYLEPV